MKKTRKIKTILINQFFERIKDACLVLIGRKYAAKMPERAKKG